jgi:hypothetical protein
MLGNISECPSNGDKMSIPYFFTSAKNSESISSWSLVL